MDILHSIEYVLEIVVESAVIVCNAIGIGILMHAIISSLIAHLKKDESVRLALAQGIALALEFKLGAEVLHTVTVRDWNELGILGAIVVLRAALAFLIHWEVKAEKEHLAELAECEKCEAEAAAAAAAAEAAKN